MIFKLHKDNSPPSMTDYEAWTWLLERADGSVVCHGPQAFGSEKEARSNIAQAKRSMKGAMRCKVVTLDG